MADTDIDAIKLKKAEYDKQYRLKRKLLLQQQACTSSESDLAEKNKLLTCDMYMYRLRHIHDPVLSSLKMEGIRLVFFTEWFHHCFIPEVREYLEKEGLPLNFY
jgi:alcohol dehydrogenase class IV